MVLAEGSTPEEAVNLSLMTRPLLDGGRGGVERARFDWDFKPNNRHEVYDVTHKYYYQSRVAWNRPKYLRLRQHCSCPGNHCLLSSSPSPRDSSFPCPPSVH